MAPQKPRDAIEGHTLRRGELVFSAREERVLTLDDLVYRSSRLAWRPELTRALRRDIEAVIETNAPDLRLWTPTTPAAP